ncbi:MAG: methylated-DNA--[protein]-cysteine S-methyltransferase [Undibacterium sp.]|nr:methylated-DNA--[protein]-cysteine S-methyltransferase [Opitutaceae bacterium]
MNVYFDTFPTPAGEFSIAINDVGAVVATAFGSETALRAQLKSSFDELIRSPKRVASPRAQVLAYFSGKRNGFDLSLAPVGTPFQQRVWTALQEIPFGETRSYGALAKMLASGSRAIGRANAANPICLIVPCHRVIGADGSLTGFAFGEEIKLRLLRHEGALAAA